jgi:hypothetical protein
MTKEKLLSEILLRIDKIEEKQTLYSQLIRELRANSVPKSKISKNKQTKSVKRISVRVQVTDFLIKYPNNVWTSDELAKKIGCSGAAVRKTAVWNGYQKQKAETKQQCSIRKGFKDKNGNIVATTKDNNEIDD